MTRNVWGSDLPVEETKGGTSQSSYVTGDILYASGTDTLAKRAIGSTDEVLAVSSGVPNYVTAGMGSATFSIACTTLTAAQLKAINSSPVTLIAAQGASTTIVPFFWSARLNYGSEVFATGADIEFVFNGLTNREMEDVPSGLVTAAADSVCFGRMNYGGRIRPPSEVSNLSLDIRADADFTGNASDDGTVEICVWYTVETI